ncbi:MAG: undecaprenyldiphospho-muramoylpentapeptide beta-N-acetylglucosaminyltransferase [Desulfobacterales bacterium]
MNSAGHRGADGAKAESPLNPGDFVMRLVIAGAGTGGHLFPGIAVADELMKRSSGSRVLFITTGRPVERTVLADRSFEISEISASGFKGMGLLKKMGALTVLPRGLFQSLRLLKSFRADAVLGMGAYSSAPVLVAASLSGIPGFIHEQNRIAGMTNRWLGRFAKLVFVSFKDTCIGSNPGKIVYTGNPVRSEIRRCAKARMQVEGKDPEDQFTVLVLGGSQGASAINTAMTEAFSHITNPEKFRVIHQTGTRDEETVRLAYESMGVEATVSAFFNDMESVYKQADLAVCRAGASTVAEIAAVGLPAVFVPFPHAADDHQAANAEGLESAGAAEIIYEKDLNGRELARRLQYYQEDEASFKRFCAAAENAGRADAASLIVDEIAASLTAKHRQKKQGRG